MSRFARLLGACALLVALGGCGVTGGALITLPFQVGGVERSGSGPMTFTSLSGWTVELDTAQILLGPFYFNVSPPPTNAFRGGTFIIEVTDQVLVNPLDPTMNDVPGGADGETGKAVAVEIDLFPPDSTQSPQLASDLGQAFASVSGTATLGPTTVPFSGLIQIDASLTTPQLPLEALERVNGAAANLVFTAKPQQLELRVDPTHWFDLCDFNELTVPPAGSATWSVDGTFGQDLLEGVRQLTGVYNFQLVDAS